MLKKLTYFQAEMSTYTMLSHVLDSDSEILKSCCFLFFFKKSHQKSPFKGLFFKIFLWGDLPRTPLVLLGYQLRAPLLQIKSMGNTAIAYRIVKHC